MQRIIPGGEGEGAAFHRQRRFRIDCIVHGGIDGKRQVTDGQGGFAVLRCRAGFDAVFAVRPEGQRPAAAKHHPGAVLALDNGVFRIGAAGFVIIGGGIGEGIFGSGCRFDGDLAALAAKDGGAVLTGEGQTVEHQRNAAHPLFHLHTAIGAAAGKQIGACTGDGQGGAVDGDTIRGGRRHLSVGKADFGAAGGGGGFRRVCGAARRQDQGQKQCKYEMDFFHRISPCLYSAGRPQEISRLPLRQRMASSSSFSPAGSFSRTR